METFATAGIAGAFGRGFLSEAIRDTYQLIKNTATYQYPLIQSTLLEIDLKSYLRSVEIMLLEIEIDADTPAAIKYCYDEVINCIQNIKTELIYIQNAIEEHPKKWASYLRRPNYKKNLKRLRLYKVNCDRRLDLLMKSIELHSRPSSISRGARSPARSNTPSPSSQPSPNPIRDDYSIVHETPKISECQGPFTREQDPEYSNSLEYPGFPSVPEGSISCSGSENEEEIGAAAIEHPLQ